MSKEDLVEAEGVVTEVLPDARFRVKLDSGHDVMAYTSGRMRKARIRVLTGDRVTLVNDDTVMHHLGPLSAAPGRRAATVPSSLSATSAAKAVRQA